MEQAEVLRKIESMEKELSELKREVTSGENSLAVEMKEWEGTSKEDTSDFFERYNL